MTVCSVVENKKLFSCPPAGWAKKGQLDFSFHIFNNKMFFLLSRLAVFFPTRKTGNYLLLKVALRGSSPLRTCSIGHIIQLVHLLSRYDLLTNQWTTVSHMTSARAWPAVAVIDKKIYVMGGFDGTNRLSSAEVYDPETDQWASLSNMKVSRAGCAAAVL